MIGRPAHLPPGSKFRPPNEGKRTCNIFLFDIKSPELVWYWILGLYVEDVSLKKIIEYNLLFFFKILSCAD